MIGVVVVAVVLAAFGVLLARTRSARAGAGGRHRGRGVHALERERSISYFQDLSGRGSEPGVQEEDRTGRWGSGSSEREP